MRVVQRVLGSIARQVLVCKEALPRKSSAERGKLGAAAPHEGVAELGGHTAGPYVTYRWWGGLTSYVFFNHGISPRVLSCAA